MSRAPFDTTRRFEKKEGTIAPSITRNTGSNTVMGPQGPKGDRGPVGNLDDGTAINQIMTWDGAKWVPNAAIVTEVDPTAAAEKALTVGACFGSVVVAPLGTGTSDIARVQAILSAVGGTYPIKGKSGDWYDTSPALITTPMDNLWAVQTIWYIDSSAGSDLNKGDATHPLKSFSEFQRRMRGQILDTLYTVNITGNLDEMPIDFDIGPNGYLDIIFTVTAVATYTVNAFTPANPGGTAQVEKIQTVETGSAAGLIGKRIRFTSGAASSCTAWATQSLTGYDDHTFEMSKPISFTRTNGTWIWADGEGAHAQPANGDTFVVETLPVVSSMSVHIRRHGGQGFCFAIRNAQFGTSGTPIQDPIFDVEGWGSTVGCAWYVQGLQTNGYHVSDGFLKGAVIRGLATPIDKARFLACYFNGSILVSDVVLWDSIFKHGSIAIESGEVHFIGLTAIMCEIGDSIQDAVFLYSAACRLIINTNGESTGYTLMLNYTRYAFNIPPGAVVAYTVLPLGGAANYAIVGSTIKNSSEIPYIEPASNAAMIIGMNGGIG